MIKSDIITIGGAVKDFTFYTDQGKIFSTPQNLATPKMLAFEYGGKINAKEVYLNFGGGAANSAVSFSKLGFKTAAIIRIGRDEIGREIVNNLKKQKVNTGLIQLDNKNHSGFSFIIATDKKDREHIVFSSRGANEMLSINASKLGAPASHWFYLTSLSGKNWVVALKEIFKSASKNQTKIAWNPGNLQLAAGKKALAVYLEQTQVLILNKDEAIELVLSGVKLGRRNPNFLNQPVYLLNILHEWGPKIVVITGGKKGAWAYDGKKIYRQNIFKAKVLDTTGVGDAFGSSFLAGLIINKTDIGKALKWGMINSASVLTEVGAQNGLLSRQELEEKLKSFKQKI
ncbi:MAG: carbohydrate kinase family protein [Patescibacteria group bacterium]|jgi:sugar/nucleoside kinase (ribokinase family)